MIKEEDWVPKPPKKVQLEEMEVGVLLEKKIKKKIAKLDQMSNKERYDFIDTYFEQLHLDEYREVFNSDKFLSSLNEVLRSRNIDPPYRVKYNNVIYYLIAKSKRDEYRYKLLIMIGEALNQNDTLLMLGIDIPYDLAVYLAVSAYSSLNPNISVKRVNFLLTTAFTSSFMTVQKIIEVYEEIYATCFSCLLSANTFDITIKSEIDADATWITDNIVKIHESINWATLYILESLPPQNITRYLQSIAEQYSVEGYDKSKVRFSYHNLPRSFVKIPIIVEQLEGLNNDIELP